MVLNKQPFFPNLLKRPPYALHIFWRHSPIRFIEIYPEAHATGHLCKFSYVALHRVATFIVEGGNSKFFDVALACKSKFFFNRDLDWQTVTVPSGFSYYLFAFHRLKTRKSILKNTSFNMVGSRNPVCCWRAFKECPVIKTFTCGNALLENALSLPKSENRLLDSRQVYLWGERLELRHELTPF